MVYRSLDAVERLSEEHFEIGLVNKPTPNVVDEDMIKIYGCSPFVVTIGSLAQKTGLGSRLGTHFLKRKLTPKYKIIGSRQEGCGGLHEQIVSQGMAPGDIVEIIRDTAAK